MGVLTILADDAPNAPAPRHQYCHCAGGDHCCYGSPRPPTAFAYSTCLACTMPWTWISKKSKSTLLKLFCTSSWNFPPVTAEKLLTAFQKLKKKNKALILHYRLLFFFGFEVLTLNASKTPIYWFPRLVCVLLPHTVFKYLLFFDL